MHSTLARCIFGWLLDWVIDRSIKFLVAGLALGPLHNGDRTLYYHSFASLRESWVLTSVLRNESVYSSGFNTAPREFKSSVEARASQAASEAFDSNGEVCPSHHIRRRNKYLFRLPETLRNISEWFIYWCKLVIRLNVNRRVKSFTV